MVLDLLGGCGAATYNLQVREAVVSHLLWQQGPIIVFIKSSFIFPWIGEVTIIHKYFRSMDKFLTISMGKSFGRGTS